MTKQKIDFLLYFVIWMTLVCILAFGIAILIEIAIIENLIINYLI